MRSSYNSIIGNHYSLFYQVRKYQDEAETAQTMPLNEENWANDALGLDSTDFHYHSSAEAEVDAYFIHLHRHSTGILNYWQVCGSDVVLTF